MPTRQPFTGLCRSLARPRHAGRADLHLHTTASDGTYAPAEVVDLARRCGLSALAVTDHDTLAALPATRAAAAGSDVEIISGVEVTTVYRDRELHLLAYFVAEEDAPLAAALARVRASRAERFREMVERLRGLGVSVEEDERAGPAPDALGRRYLAELLVRQGRVSTVREAFARYLGDHGRVAVPKLMVPVAEALALVRGAGGVAAWAHPAYDCALEALRELTALGLGAVEVEYPGTRPTRSKELRSWAQALGLAVSGGSDCHGPGPRPIGACTVSAEELEQLRRRAR
jgi:predicted metal-dependent phosphoesterase TrpH